MPDSNYILNNKSSQCSNGVSVFTDRNDNTIKIKDLTNEGTSCYLYYDKIVLSSDRTLTNLYLSSQGEIGPITGPSCEGTKNSLCYNGSINSYNKENNMAQNGVYEAEDDFGISYVFRGTVNNNWVKFGKITETSEDIWWRIIRINGNGTIRLIYAGKGSNTPETTGIGTRTSMSDFNISSGDNTYVGFMYGEENSDNYESTHQNTNKSIIMSNLESWYNTTNLEKLKNKIDVETGFCNDRDLATEAHGSYGIKGYGKEDTAYAGADRLWKEKSASEDTVQRPTLKCGKDTISRKRDLFTGPNATKGGTNGANGNVEGNNKLTKPVGLITMDEVIYGGSFISQYNSKYWLYTNSGYWTMTPFVGSSYTTDVFNVSQDGLLHDYPATYSSGMRPVINLKADTTLLVNNPNNKGTINNPYIVQ